MTNNVDNCLKVLRDSYKHDAEGDRCVMFAALYNRLVDKSLFQERHKRPARTRVIHKKLEADYGVKGLPKWGATAVRGDLMDNKEHIRLFIDAINKLEEYEVQEAWEKCVADYKERMDALYTPILLNTGKTLANAIQFIIEKKSGGRTQQPICFAAVKVLYDALSDVENFSVLTKKVFAGDAQSMVKGDVQVNHNDKILLSVEVKAHVVDNAKILEVLNDHGSHTYPLIIAANAFKEPVDSYQNLTLVSIPDFVFSTINHAAVVSKVPL
ncbi:hypothetical protein CGH64_24170, partial [Vibrio parahaemolyticus]